MTETSTVDTLVAKIQKQNEYAIAKSITLLENQTDPIAIEVRKAIYKTKDKTYVVGITGAPGAGKSTLINALVNQLNTTTKIGIVSIDPSNKDTGGALLGDRIRMAALFTKPNVFIRSMSNRGIFGGLNKAIYDVVQLFSYARYDLIIVETIGVGQNEVDISQIADTVMVVSSPESGDSIQAIKAGLMEIADIYIINKTDLPGAQKMEYILKENLATSEKPNQWIPEIVKIQANTGKNLHQLEETIQKHKQFLVQHNGLYQRRKQLLQKNIMESVTETFAKRFIQPQLQASSFQFQLHRIMDGDTSFDETVHSLVQTIEKEVQHEN